jgi:rhodanese-related sulfurtransferase
MMRQGYRNVYVLVGGLRDWLFRNYPVKRGEEATAA